MADPIVPSSDKNNNQHKQRPNRKLIYGVGVVDVPYVPVDHKQKFTCPFYQVWWSMLTRCYSSKFHKGRPTYIGCNITPEWHSLSIFRGWMEKQNWQGMHLDKDFLSDSKVYGPDTCVFIPAWLNTIFKTHPKDSELPVGVKPNGVGRYQSRLRIRGKTVCLGTFASPSLAHAAYVEAKTKYVRSRYPEIEQIDARLVAACERRINQINSGF
jgi:hypothetical protein